MATATTLHPPGRCDPAMALVLSAQERQRFDAMPDIIYALHPDLTIGYVNSAWFRNAPDPEFQARWGLGADVRDAWPDRLGRLLERITLGQLADGAGSRPLRIDYACPTPQQHRRFSQWLHALPGAVLVVNAQWLAQQAPEPEPVPPQQADYMDAQGLMHQCLNCRRTQRPGTHRWDWVPAWLSPMPNEATSDLCPPCERSYLQRLQQLADGVQMAF